jgi:hypothetical protein
VPNSISMVHQSSSNVCDPLLVTLITSVGIANMLCWNSKHVVSCFVLKVGVTERLMSQLGVDTLLQERLPLLP